MHDFEPNALQLSVTEREAEKTALVRLLAWAKLQAEELGANHSANCLEQAITALEKDE